MKCVCVKSEKKTALLILVEVNSYNFLCCHNKLDVLHNHLCVAKRAQVDQMKLADLMSEFPAVTGGDFVDFWWQVV